MILETYISIVFWKGWQQPMAWLDSVNAASAWFAEVSVHLIARTAFVMLDCEAPDTEICCDAIDRK